MPWDSSQDSGPLRLYSVCPTHDKLISSHLLIFYSCYGWCICLFQSRVGKSAGEGGQLEHCHWRFLRRLHDWLEMLAQSTLNIEARTVTNYATVRTTPAFFGYGAGLSILMGAFDYCGARFSGYKKDPTVDEVDRKTELRRNRRKPIEETVAELGEGRGMRFDASARML